MGVQELTMYFIVKEDSEYLFITGSDRKTTFYQSEQVFFWHKNNEDLN